MTMTGQQLLRSLCSHNWLVQVAMEFMSWEEQELKHCNHLQPIWIPYPCSAMPRRDLHHKSSAKNELLRRVSCAPRCTPLATCLTESQCKWMSLIPSTQKFVVLFSFKNNLVQGSHNTYEDSILVGGSPGRSPKKTKKNNRKLKKKKHIHINSHQLPSAELAELASPSDVEWSFVELVDQSPVEHVEPSAWIGRVVDLSNHEITPADDQDEWYNMIQPQCLRKWMKMTWCMFKCCFVSINHKVIQIKR